MEGLQDGQISLAWNIAAFQRQKKLKKMETYLSKEKKQLPVNVADKMRTMFGAHNKKVK